MAKHPTAPLIPGGTRPLLDPESPLSHRPTEPAPGATSRYDTAARNAPTHAPAAGKPLTGKVLAGKYELGMRLGVGGMGEVYRASHLSLGVDVAVKIMHPHVAAVDEYMRRFRREAYAASLLAHRNVVRVLDFGDDDSLLLPCHGASPPWKEPPPGSPAPCTPPPHRRSRPHLPPGPRRLLKPLTPPASSTATSSPKNASSPLEPDGKEIPKVLDFGLAHVEDHRDAGPTLTTPDIVSGTPEYMSPGTVPFPRRRPQHRPYALGCSSPRHAPARPLHRRQRHRGDDPAKMFVPPPPLGPP
ncbi:MAG: hypothetical protein R3B70_45900 [Polyangiaceae bacterium]